jgi:hypothetical protein
MKRLAAVAILAVAVLPVCAQRGGARGDFSGHTGASSFHGGSGSSAPSHFGAAPSHFGSAPSRFAAPSHFTSPRFNAGNSFRGNAPYQRSGFGNGGARAPYNSPNRYRRSYRSRYSSGSPYLFPGGVVSWINPDFLGYPGYYDDFSAATDTSAQSYEEQPTDQDRPSYEPSYAPRSYVQPLPNPGPENAVTLMFKNGRPSEQIHNYALTRTTLYVLDQHHQDIPIEALDLAATEQVNRDAGIDFQLPVVVQ